MTRNKKTKRIIPIGKLTRVQEVILGLILIGIGLIMFFSFLSFLITWRADQSIIDHLSQRELPAQNWISKLGAGISNFFIYDGFGIAALSIPTLITITGIYLFAARKTVFTLSRKRIINLWFWGLLLMLWTSVTLGFFSNTAPLLGGKVGIELNDFMQDYIGLLGTIIVIIILAIIYLILRLGITPEKLSSYYATTIKDVKKDFEPTYTTITDEEKDWKTATKEGENEQQQQIEPDIIPQSTTNTLNISDDQPAVTAPTQHYDDMEITIANDDDDDDEDDNDNHGSNDDHNNATNTLSINTNQVDTEVDVEINTVIDDDEMDFNNKADQLVEDFGEYDPTLELGNFKFPPIDLLKDYTLGKTITINEEELQANKLRIVDTLKNYKIGIAKITATIGPTVTLYEIVPEAGIRISKIKNLEDDIALSLSALGIRIIAPIPGKGTIGIEVPNQKPSIVSMRSVIKSPKFQNAEMELPIAFGKTISNETFVVDLAKMPHMLMAGATGQGKSVGLNAVLTSLLYAKHPAEVKFVLVDPKKVELTLFNKIERHYLAKLPDSEEAIITDNKKVINTLNSLCIEMDQRYDILKDAMCRNIKEYNDKFKARKLNPANGHKYLPYIVLVVDEFADLIMTAGKEVETPIARLAQLARAIGIHLIIATQRPSVNVITGMIKANFPARVSFRVQQKVDSRTILDSGGAEQLIGRGDMLYTSGNDIIRLQCAFVDTPEVEKITDYIGAQKAYPDAHMLPEYVGEEDGTSIDIDIQDRDSKFREAAEIIVTAQQGSASLLQRKLKLGYNRAGRIIDQLEAAGVVGGFEGSKARQVLINDLNSLDQLLNNEQQD